MLLKNKKIKKIKKNYSNFGQPTSLYTFFVLCKKKKKVNRFG